MSLLSLLIALAAERSLSSSWWRFQHYFQGYSNFVDDNSKLANLKQSTLGKALFIVIPVLLTVMILDSIDNGLIHLLLSTVILIVCFGCVGTRESYKHYLQSAFRGEETTTALHHQQLLEDKNLPPMGFGQALIWLNYRYYIAIMLYFTLFGAAGVVFYRLLCAVIEQENSACQAKCQQDEQASASEQAMANDANEAEFDEADFDEIKQDPSEHEQNNPPSLTGGCNNHHDVLFWLDWLPVRITSFGYMFVGHFTRAMPVWLESLFDFQKPTHRVLIDVAEKSEDIMIGENDCTAEPCLLVRLAKRTVLLMLAIISVLILAGVLS
ncbi:beta-lactamase regulator AmpE [Litorilituus sediminis]|uniref:Beta-lactamase regulator AmpE n=1 Tax=Litorilituus sediminis TaxID=718192 RepID=A0A4P6P915_9GAMM|nr:beta-lactamase regulator AmpE [Litorilituus sediminis]QBG36062.1 beta-lactamase regulator AmpE [Litorilituus sediminis]